MMIVFSHVLALPDYVVKILYYNLLFDKVNIFIGIMLRGNFHALSAKIICV